MTFYQPISLFESLPNCTGIHIQQIVKVVGNALVHTFLSFDQLLIGFPLKSTFLTFYHLFIGFSNKFNVGNVLVNKQNLHFKMFHIKRTIINKIANSRQRECRAIWLQLLFLRNNVRLLRFISLFLLFSMITFI